MEAAGIVSHGGFGFAKTDTAGVDALLPALDVYWIESPHFRIGLGLSPYKPKQGERKKIRAELTEMATVLEEVNPKAKTIDTWLRLHIYAQRMEKTAGAVSMLLYRAQVKLRDAFGHTDSLSLPDRSLEDSEGD